MLPLFRLSARRENRPLKGLTFPKSLGNLNPMHRSLLLILFPRTPGNVPPHNRLDREDVVFLDYQAPSLELTMVRCDLLGESLERGGQQVVGAFIAQELEPEGRERGEELAFVGDSLYHTGCRLSSHTDRVGTKGRTFSITTSYAEILSVAANSNDFPSGSA
jgi:hypothetical protein